MKIVATIVNKNRQLIGFMAEGKESEFGGVGSKIITTSVSKEELLRSKFKNSQIEVVTEKVVTGGGVKTINKICCKGNFLLKNLPMKMFDNGEFTAIDNSILLTARIMHNGSLAGFEYSIGGIKGRDTTDNIIRLSNWHKTANFVVRHFDDNRLNIAGRPGMSLDKLPIITTYGDKPTKETKKTKRTVVDNKGREMDMPLIRPYEFIGLCEEVSAVGGTMILLPGTVYNHTTALNVKTSKEFKKTGVELSYPKVEGGESSLNASLPFKQIGQLIVNVGGIDKTYYPFTYKKKNVYQNGEINTPYLGVAIKKDAVKQLQEKFGKSLALAEITDLMTNMYVKTFLQVKNPEEIILLSVNTDKLSLMSKETAKKYILDAADLRKYVRNRITGKVVAAYANTLKKEAEADLPKGSAARPLYGPYSVCSGAELEALEMAGINVFDGSFTKVEEKTEVEVSKDKEKIEKIPDMAAEYGIAGLKGASPKYADLVAKEALREKYSIEFKLMSELHDKYESLSSPEDRYKIATEAYNAFIKKRDECTEAIWKHNIASLTLGDLTSYKIKDVSSWEFGKALKSGQTYTCNAPGAVDLVLNLKGVKAV